MKMQLGVLALCATLGACGGSSGGGGDSDSSSGGGSNVGSNSNSPLANTVWFLCDSLNATSTGVEYSFTQSDYTQSYATYENNSCSGTPSTQSETAAGTYELGLTERMTASGFTIRDLDLTATSAFGVPLSSGDERFDIIHIANDFMLLARRRGDSAMDRPDELDEDSEFELQ
jgi:hypothetical protein